MSKKLSNCQKKTSDIFVRKIFYFPQKKSKVIFHLNERNSSLDNTSSKQNNNKKIRVNSNSKDIKSQKNFSNEKVERCHLMILSPNSKTKISYQNEFNNNAIYCSGLKNKKFTPIYKNYYLNTESKLCSYQKSNILKKNNIHSKYIKNNLGMNTNRKMSKYGLKNDTIENSKINYTEEDKNSNNFYINNLSAEETDKNIFNKTIKNNLEIINKKPICIPRKKHLSDIISPKKLLDFSKKRNRNIVTIERNNNNIKRNNNYVKDDPIIIDPEEYIKLNKIGHGSFGKIFKVKWKKNNKCYAMKEMNFIIEDNILYLKERTKLIMDFEKKVNCNGLIKIYGDCSFKKGNKYFYYEIMELANRDWEQEIKIRNNNSKYYTEKELFSIMIKLIKTLSLMQQNHITHRDIKLENILIVNNKYKICDFGESRTLNQKGKIVQPVRGSELYMSPILFFGLNQKLKQVIHNTFKSDVFSLGMCILFAANLNDIALYDIREMTNMNEIRKVLKNYLDKRYSNYFIEILLCMLEFNENERPDFIQLEKVIFQNGIIN